MFNHSLCPDAKVAKTEEIISYRFTHRQELQRALQLADEVHKNGNKDLALLGDTVIRLILVKEGLRREATREQISNVIAKRASNAYLAQRGYLSGLDECVFRNRSQGEKIFGKPMATTMEAIVGAVFKDSRENTTVVTRVMDALGISWPE